MMDIKKEINSGALTITLAGKLYSDTAGQLINENRESAEQN